MWKWIKKLFTPTRASLNIKSRISPDIKSVKPNTVIVHKNKGLTVSTKGDIKKLKAQGKINR
jgi:hypothetical protein